MAREQLEGCQSLLSGLEDFPGASPHPHGSETRPACSHGHIELLTVIMYMFLNEKIGCNDFMAKTFQLL